MKKFFLSLAAAAVTLSVAAGDLVLKYDRPANFFEETLVIGNGNLGAILYGGIKEDRLSLNDITLWTGGPEKGVTTPDAYKAIPEIREAIDRGDYRTADNLQRKVQGHYSENYQPLGTLTITYKNAPDSSDRYVRMLDINDAVAFRGYTASGKAQGAIYFASAPDSVIVVSIKSETPVSAVVALSSQLPHEVAATGNEIKSMGYVAAESLPSYTKFDEKLRYDTQGGTRFCTIVEAVASDGKVVANSDGTLGLDGCKDVVLYITNVTSFNGFDKDPVNDGRNYESLAQARINKAAAKGFNDILKSHLEDYHSYFDRVTIDLGTTPDSIASLPTDVQLKRYTDLKEVNPDLEELYFQYGRYLLLSSARTPGVPANLQGLWNEYLLPPWSSNYTTNINVEENYWPAEVTGLGDLHETSMIRWIANLQKSGEQTAKHYYGVDRGWCLGHNSDIWAMTNPVGMNTGDPSWANWNMGGAWVATHIWEHYLFTKDREYLAKYYPVLRGAAEFCLGWLIEKDGYLMTSPATSPENMYLTPDGYVGATMYGGSADIAMIRQCLMDARDAAKELGVDFPLQAEIDTTLTRLLPYKIGKKGNLQEWYYDWDDKDPTHRHQSHLFGLFPGRHISVDSTPDLAKAAARTLEIKGDNTTGWSTGWRVNLLARLRDSQNAYHMYRRLLQYVSPDKYQGPDKRSGGGTYPNLLDAHAPFQIDGNFGGTAGVAEMLIQSTPESITLLPALPEEWNKGNVAGLRARGGFTVDMAWDNGKIVTATISSLAGGITQLSYPGEAGIVTKTITIGPGETVKVK
ncbi:MAG: glycoside hydrolase N-terminal domain-containing protein [Duncaniella sp.]|nr:glycoside hydrolase N-terminal domain-containing protein [Duncaniella sp.]